MSTALEYWYAAVVPPGKEAEAIRQVEQRGHETFHPFCHRVHRSTRKSGARALITGYIFIAVEDYAVLSELWMLPIIWRFLGARRSGRIRPKDMKVLRELTEERKQVPMINRDEYWVGQLCEVITGPLTGQLLKVEKITGDGKQKPWQGHVTTQFFRSKQLVSLPLDWLVPA